jgi:tripartite-type tricarboxylate transporter receptor subunit TctC
VSETLRTRTVFWRRVYAPASLRWADGSAVVEALALVVAGIDWHDALLNLYLYAEWKKLENKADHKEELRDTPKAVCS